MRINLFVVLFCLMTPVVMLAQAPFEAAAEAQALLDEATADQQLPGLVLWVDAPEHRFAGASGVRDLQSATPMTPTDSFRIGSMTKMFTATVVLQLMEEGALTLDDTLAQWLPDLAIANAETITLRHMLQHTSGVPSFTANPAYFDSFLSRIRLDGHRASLECDVTPQEVVQTFVVGQPPDFAPGEVWLYSNSNYVLLGLIIEAASGQSLVSNYEQRLLGPLGLENTYLECYQDPVGVLAHGYAIYEDQRYDAFGVRESAAWAAGNIVSNGPDLVAFTRALFNGDLYRDPATLHLMMEETRNNYGLGVMVYGSSYGHGGTINGYVSWLEYHPDTDAVVVIFQNDSSPNMNHTLRASRLLLAELK